VEPSEPAHELLLARIGWLFWMLTGEVVLAGVFLVLFGRGLISAANFFLDVRSIFLFMPSIFSAFACVSYLFCDCSKSLLVVEVFFVFFENVDMKSSASKACFFGLSDMVYPPDIDKPYIRDMIF
jgi:hypothetical protein